jgi:hypothetical protein
MSQKPEAQVQEKVYYSVYGLNLVSNRAIPGLGPLSDMRAADVEVDLAGGLPPFEVSGKLAPVEWYISPGANQTAEPVLKVWKVQDGAYYHLRYGDGIEFVLDHGGTQVWAGIPGNATLEDVAYYLLGPILGLLLRFRGTICLHGSAVAVGGKVLSLVGSAGAGKSTTATAFARLGYPVVTDDITALEENGGDFLVHPGAPRLCMWPDSVNVLYGSPEALPRLTPEDAVDPQWDKRWLDLTTPGYRFQSRPLALRAIYILGERDIGGPHVEAVARGASLIALLANTYGSYLMEKSVRAQEFEVLSRLLDRAAVRQVTPHPDPAYIPGMCDLILEDYHALSRPALPKKASS